MRRRDKKRMLQNLLILFGMAAVFFYVYIQKQSKEKRLKMGHVFTIGKVNGMIIRGKSSNVEYEYKVDNKVLEGKYYEFSEKSFDKYKSLGHVDFRVIYEPSCPSNSALLLRKEDYIKFGISLDSMGNVIDFY